MHSKIDREGDQITLRPVRPKALVKKEHGVWVYQGEAAHASIPDLIDRDRQRRLHDVAR